MVGEIPDQALDFDSLSQSRALIRATDMCDPVDQLMHRVSEWFVRQPPSLARAGRPGFRLLAPPGVAEVPTRVGRWLPVSDPKEKRNAGRKVARGSAGVGWGGGCGESERGWCNGGGRGDMSVVMGAEARFRSLFSATYRTVAVRAPPRPAALAGPAIASMATLTAATTRPMTLRRIALSVRGNIFSPFVIDHGMGVE